MVLKAEKSWQVPPQAAQEKDKLGWVDESCEEGLLWHKAQRSHDDYLQAFRILSGDPRSIDTPAYRSKLTTGRLKRNIREVIGACANISPLWVYASDNDAFSEQTGLMNKVSRAIYLERNLDGAIKEALQWSAATATGWIRPVYRRDMGGHGKGDLTFLTYGSPSVLPNQLPSNGNFQEAYSVTILDEMPVWMAHALFPKYQEQLKPTSSKFWYDETIRKAARGNMFRRVFGGGRRTGNEDIMRSDLFIPIRYTYIIDLTLNKTGSMIPMGEYGTSWFYEVQPLGKEVIVGVKENGDAITHKVTEDEARLYPYRRLIISSEKVILYDGPAFDWHGEFPGVPFCLDKWVWEPLGLSLLRDGIQVDKSLNELERGVMDKHTSRLDPSLAYDINSVNMDQARSLDPLAPRQRVGFDSTLAKKPFVPIVPDEMLRVDPMTMQFIEHLRDTGDYQLAIRDIISMAKARSSLGGGVNDIQRMMEADGPIVRDISRNIERSLSKVGQQCKYHILQYYDTRRVMQYVGPDAITRDTFYYDPNSLVPSHMPDENKEERSRFNKVERARNFADNLRLYITPHSAHEIVQMSHRLGLIQLRKAGVQIDSRTLAESWNLYNFGDRPRGNTIYERYWDEQNDLAQHAVKVKQLVDYVQQAGMGLTPALGAAANQVTPFVPPREGRPPSGKEAPILVQKDQGARATISESGP